MNRTVLIGAVLVVLAALGYYQFVQVPAQNAVEEAAASAAAESEAAAAKAAAEAAAETQAAEDAAKAASDAAADSEAAAADAVTKAATEAAGAVTGAVEAATEAATEAAAAATAAATGAATAMGDTATMVWDATKLTGQEIVARIEAAPVTDSVKQTLLTSYNAVKDNSAGVQMVLDQLKQAIGL